MNVAQAAVLQTVSSVRMMLCQEFRVEAKACLQDHGSKLNRQSQEHKKRPIGPSTTPQAQVNGHARGSQRGTSV
jgi:hypothetical protein